MKKNVVFYLLLSNDEFNNQKNIISSMFVDEWFITFKNIADKDNTTYERLYECFVDSKMNSFDFAFISLSPCRLTKKGPILKIINQIEAENKSIALRIGNIKGIDLTYPPKCPLIDPSLIIIFPKNCQISERAKYYSHFSSIDPLFFDLSAFVENYFTSDSLMVFESESHVLNIYGEQSQTLYDDFTYSRETGIVTYKNLNPVYHKLIENLQNELTLNVFISRGVLEKFYIKVKHLLLTFMKKNELVKRYDI